MCGIAGLVNFKSAPSRKIVSSMLAVIKYRGPDSCGIHQDDNATMGTRRLSIIDVSGGDQPIYNEDKTEVIVFNGEIYNYKTLHDEMIKKGHKFRTASDTEVVLHLYEDYGVDVPKYLSGMFAFAIWDKKNQSLFLARDHAGIKPLYYSFTESGLIFGSELKTLLNTNLISKQINKKALDLYFSLGYFPGKETIIQGIYKLEPGTCLLYSRTKRKVSTYWSLFTPDKTIAKNLDNLLEETITAQTVSDVAWGVLLSGGIDSSLITYYLAKTNRKVKTFSIGFEDKQFDESTYAREVSRIFGTKHQQTTFSSADIKDLFPKITDLLDEPLADPAIFPAFKVSELARKDVKVALSGDGADELFGGYPTYVGHDFADCLNLLLPDFISKVLPNISALQPLNFGSYDKKKTLELFFKTKGLSLFSRQYYWASRIGNVYKNLEILDEKTQKEISAFDSKSLRAQATDFLTYLPDDLLFKADRASMYNSLEVRVPFLDPKIISYAFSKNNHADIFKTKKLLRKIAADKLPETITKRKKKGFGIPLSLWLKTDLLDLALHYLNNQELLEYIDLPQVENSWQSYLSGKVDNSRYLWMLIMFSAWLEKWH